MSSANRALSARQAQVAELIARGSSNREIAATLSLSGRTVEAHVAAVFNKLNVRSRTELAAAVLRAAFERAPQRSRTNLPFQVNRLIGREPEIAHLTGLLSDERLVTVTGAGGVGKTSTALEVGGMLLDREDAGVWLVELAPLRDGSLVAATLARTLDVRKDANRPLLDTIVAHLRQQTTLLILDNCEHVIKDAAVIASALIRGCPGLRILATSREPLRVAGEHTRRLPSLSVPEPDAVRRLAASDAVKYAAVELFVERATAADNRFALTDENAPAVADICRRLDGIPLAIELAAARIKILNPKQLRERLDERFRVLTAGSHDVLARHQTLRALLDWSHDLLDVRERALFRRVGVFVDGFTLPGAVAVSSDDDLDELDVLDLLASLVDKSLVLTDPDGEAPRYRMLESTRAYAREKLAAAGELSASLVRHRRYLRDLFVSTQMRVDGSGRTTEIDALLVAELEDVRVALDVVAGSAEPELAAELLASIDNRWLWIGLVSEGCSRLERCISRMTTGQGRLTSRLWTAFARTVTADGARAHEAAAMAVGLARDANDSDTLAQALTMYADSLARPSASAYENAAAALTEAEALASAQNVWLRLRILRVRANLSRYSGNLDAAAQAYEQLRQTHSLLGNVYEAHVLAIVLAEVEHERGQTEKAVALLQEALPALRADRFRELLLLDALTGLCGYLVALDRLSEARAVAREAIGKNAEHDVDEMNTTIALEHLALAIALDRDVRRGAQLAGFTEAALKRSRYVPEYSARISRARLAALFRARLAPAERDELLAAGAALSAKDAVALALTHLAE